MKENIVCVIPAFNEERFIKDVVNGIPDFVRHIIVVDDASTDATAKEVENLGDPRVILLNHEQNTGVGGAVIDGYRKALELGAEITVKIDGDGQMDPKEIRRLIAPIIRNKADYAKGVRFRDAEVIKKMPVSRFVGNICLSFLTKAASGYWSIFDPTNGFTAISKRALVRINLDDISKGYFFESSMLTALYNAGAVVADVPTQAHYGEETSSLSLMETLFTFPNYLLKAFFKRLVWRYFIRDFSAFSLFFILGSLLFSFGFFFGLYHWILNGLILETPTPTGTIMLSVLPLLLGFQLLLQAFVIDITNVPKTPLVELFGEEEDRPE